MKLFYLWYKMQFRMNLTILRLPKKVVILTACRLHIFFVPSEAHK